MGLATNWFQLDWALPQTTHEFFHILFWIFFSKTHKFVAHMIDYQITLIISRTIFLQQNKKFCFTPFTLHLIYMWQRTFEFQ